MLRGSLLQPSKEKNIQTPEASSTESVQTVVTSDSSSSAQALNTELKAVTASSVVETGLSKNEQTNFNPLLLSAIPKDRDSSTNEDSSIYKDTTKIDVSSTKDGLPKSTNLPVTNGSTTTDESLVETVCTIKKTCDNQGIIGCLDKLSNSEKGQKAFNESEETRVESCDDRTLERTQNLQAEGECSKETKDVSDKTILSGANISEIQSQSVLNVGIDSRRSASEVTVQTEKPLSTSCMDSGELCTKEALETNNDTGHEQKLESLSLEKELHFEIVADIDANGKSADVVVVTKKAFVQPSGSNTSTVDSFSAAELKIAQKTDNKSKNSSDIDTSNCSGEGMTEEPMDYEVIEQIDSDHSDSASDQLVITNVVSLSDVSADILENETDEQSNSVNKVNVDGRDKGEQDKTLAEKLHELPVPGKESQENTLTADNDTASSIRSAEISVSSSNTKTITQQGPRRKRKQALPSVRKGAGFGYVGEKTLEDMFVPVGVKCVSQHANTDATIAAIQSERDEQLPVISGTFSVKDLQNGSKDFPVEVKAEPPDTEGYATVLSDTVVNTQPSKTQVQTFQQIHTGNKVTPMAAVTQPTRSLIMSGVSTAQALSSGVQASRFQFTRYPVVKGLPTTASRPNPINVHILNGTVVQLPVTPSVITAASSATSANSSASKAVSRDPVTGPRKELDRAMRRMSTINIQSVGVTMITDLIARRNPIPSYKAGPVPEAIRNEMNTRTYPCYECGDTFHLQSSLDIHLGRCSMKLSYKCDKCQMVLQFTNKCQMLNHLRSHMNIDKTQAVPIHIKSDSIEITSYFEDIGKGKDFEWYKLNHGLICNECPMCGEFKYGTDSERQKHFSGNAMFGDFKCDQCRCQIRNSPCSYKAHKRLHEVMSLYRQKMLGEKGVERLVCPECGLEFKVMGRSLWPSLITFFCHIVKTCLHLSFTRVEMIRCDQCKKLVEGEVEMAAHLYKELDHYYKCEKCPMALKSLKNLQSHFQLKHKGSGQLAAKVIYRCHVCLTLIDDKSFLLQHMNSHITSFKKNVLTRSYCLTCGMIAPSVDALKSHAKTHPMRRPNGMQYCPICQKAMADYLMLMDHLFEKHMSLKPDPEKQVKFCEYCGLLCTDNKMLLRHMCLAKLNQGRVVGDVTTSNKFCKTCKRLYGNEDHVCLHLLQKEPNYVCEICKRKDFSSVKLFRSHVILCSALKRQETSGTIAKKDKLRSGGTSSGEVSTGVQRMMDPAKVKVIQLPSKRKTPPTSDRTHDEDSDDESDSEVKLTTQGTTKSNKLKEENDIHYYSCDKCPAKFPRKSRLEVHMNSEHGLHPCHLCGIMHNSSISLKRHIMIDHEGRRVYYPCLICRKRKKEKSFSVKSKLASHLKLKHRVKDPDESKFVAELPGLSGLAEKELTPEEQGRSSSESRSEPPAKKLKTEGESNYKCAKCLFTSEEKPAFVAHITEHKTPNTFQCVECGLCFSVLPSLKKHLFMVHKIRDFETYMKDNQIENPADNVHSDDEIEREPERVAESETASSEEETRNPLECKVCYKEFDSEKLLKSHMRVHGMAFIKKSRRRSQGISPNKKTKINQQVERECELLDGGGSNSLVLKIKMSKIDSQAGVRKKLDEEQSPKKSVISNKSDDSIQPDVSGQTSMKMPEQTVQSVDVTEKTSSEGTNKS